METKQVEQAMNWSGLGFGVLAATAPGVFLKAYGVHRHDEMLSWMTRLWGTRTAVISILMLRLQDQEDRRGLLTALLAMNAVDTGIALTRGSDAPAGTKRQAALTSTAFAAVSAWLLSRRDL